MAKNGSDTTNGALDALDAQISDLEQYLAGLKAARGVFAAARLDAEDEAAAPKQKRTRGKNKPKPGLPVGEDAHS